MRALATAWFVVALTACGRAQLRVPHTDAASDTFVPLDVAESDTAPATPNAVLLPNCGPTDGPAIALRVSTSPVSTCNASATVPAPFDEIDAWVDVPPGPATVMVDPAQGNAFHCQMSGASLVCNTANSGVIHFVSVSATVVTGDYSITFLDGTMRRGTFVATICAPQRMCG